MKKEKGFTLIELLAVIIILGVLMIIAIPAVTKYINDSRKSGYVSTAKNIAAGARNLINSGSLDLNDKDTTYYIDAKCIDLDNGYKSPYGDFVKAYVVVTSTGDNYEYYWTSVDDTGTGVKSLVNIDKLDIDNIETDVKQSDITTDRGLDDREYVVVVDDSCQKGSQINRKGPVINSVTGEITYICKKATTLHTATCNRTDEYGCNAEGQVGNGNTITYGTLVNGTLKAGDAYDCDVNNDGVYDSETERFYYITSDEDNSLLIYYKNITEQSTKAYDSSNENWHGPRDAYNYLPDASTWSNQGLIAPGTRSIVTENGNANTNGGLIESFTYIDKVARFLTYQEVAFTCGSSGIVTAGYFNNCTWMMESLGRYIGSSGAYGYWLETPRYSASNSAWRVTGTYRQVYSDAVRGTGSFGVRPVITIKTSNLEP